MRRRPAQALQKNRDDDGRAPWHDRLTDPFILLRHGGLAERLAELPSRPRRVVLHEPCTQRNTLNAGGVVRDLLCAIPGLELTVVRGHGCCGAAGSHMLTQPEAARSLVNALLDEVPDLHQIDTLVSANIGCAWHLRGALFDRNTDVEVVHPATFLARCFAA